MTVLYPLAGGDGGSGSANRTDEDAESLGVPPRTPVQRRKLLSSPVSSSKSKSKTPAKSRKTRSNRSTRSSGSSGSRSGAGSDSGASSSNTCPLSPSRMMDMEMDLDAGHDVGEAPPPVPPLNPLSITIPYLSSSILPIPRKRSYDRSASATATITSTSMSNRNSNTIPQELADGMEFGSNTVCHLNPHGDEDHMVNGSDPRPNYEFDRLLSTLPHYTSSDFIEHSPPPSPINFYGTSDSDRTGASQSKIVGQNRFDSCVGSGIASGTRTSSAVTTTSSVTASNPISAAKVKPVLFVKALRSPTGSGSGSQETAVELPAPARQRGVVGFLNLGNTCFMNAGLQCLLSTPSLVQFFLSVNRSTVFRNNMTLSRGKVCIAIKFLGVVKSAWIGNQRVLDLTAFKNCLGERYEQFSDTLQHDVQEFLALFLESLHQQLKQWQTLPDLFAPTKLVHPVPVPVPPIRNQSLKQTLSEDHDLPVNKKTEEIPIPDPDSCKQNKKEEEQVQKKEETMDANFKIDGSVVPSWQRHYNQASNKVKAIVETSAIPDSTFGITSKQRSGPKSRGKSEGGFKCSRDKDCNCVHCTNSRKSPSSRRSSGDAGSGSGSGSSNGSGSAASTVLKYPHFSPSSNGSRSVSRIQRERPVERKDEEAGDSNSRAGSNFEVNFQGRLNLKDSDSKGKGDGDYADVRCGRGLGRGLGLGLGGGYGSGRCKQEIMRRDRVTPYPKPASLHSWKKRRLNTEMDEAEKLNHEFLGRSLKHLQLTDGSGSGSGSDSCSNSVIKTESNVNQCSSPVNVNSLKREIEMDWLESPVNPNRNVPETEPVTVPLPISIEAAVERSKVVDNKKLHPVSKQEADQNAEGKIQKKEISKMENFEYVAPLAPKLKLKPKQRQKPRSSTELKRAQQSQKSAEEFWEEHLKKEDTVITRTMQGLMKSSVVCSVCRYESVTFDPYMDLFLPIPTVETVERSREFSIYFINLNHVGKESAFEYLAKMESLCAKDPCAYIIPPWASVQKFPFVFESSETVRDIKIALATYMFDGGISKFDDPDNLVLASVASNFIIQELYDQMNVHEINNKHNLYIYELNDNFNAKSASGSRSDSRVGSGYSYLGIADPDIEVDDACKLSRGSLSPNTSLIMCDEGHEGAPQVSSSSSGCGYINNNNDFPYSSQEGDGDEGNDTYKRHQYQKPWQKSKGVEEGEQKERGVMESTKRWAKSLPDPRPVSAMGFTEIDSGYGHHEMTENDIPATCGKCLDQLTLAQVYEVPNNVSETGFLCIACKDRSDCATADAKVPEILRSTVVGVDQDCGPDSGRASSNGSLFQADRSVSPELKMGMEVDGESALIIPGPGTGPRTPPVFSTSKPLMMVPVLFAKLVTSEDMKACSRQLFGHPWFIKIPHSMRAFELYSFFEQIAIFPKEPFSLTCVAVDGKSCAMCTSDECLGCEYETSVGDINIPFNSAICVIFTLVGERELQYYDTPDMPLNTDQREYFTAFKPELDVHIHQCIKAFMKTEHLDADNPWFCPECKVNREAAKTLSVSRFPDYLIICLKRFGFDQDLTSKKLSNRVEFPLTDFDLSGYLSPELKRIGGRKDCTFDLYGCICHSGSVYSGHYTAYTKHPLTHDWNYYNDNELSKRCPGENQYDMAYALFYKRQNVNYNIPDEIPDPRILSCINTPLSSPVATGSRSGGGRSRHRSGISGRNSGDSNSSGNCSPTGSRSNSTSRPVSHSIPKPSSLSLSLPPSSCSIQTESHSHPLLQPLDDVEIKRRRLNSIDESCECESPSPQVPVAVTDHEDFHQYSLLGPPPPPSSKSHKSSNLSRRKCKLFPDTSDSDSSTCSGKTVIERRPLILSKLIADRKDFPAGSSSGSGSGVSELNGAARSRNRMGDRRKNKLESSREDHHITWEYGDSSLDMIDIRDLDGDLELIHVGEGHSVTSANASECDEVF